MKETLFQLGVIFVFVTMALAETAPVSVRIPDKKAWLGQRVSFFIELRAPGSFEGTVNFDLPQLPGIIIIKTGNPVVSSEEIDGQSWFIQAHEFSLFSQKTGVVEIPEFSIRFASRRGFTGQTSEVYAKFPGVKVAIERPPGSEKIGFLVTTESLKITEKWIPEPGPTQAGAVLKRNIVQRAAELSGMALAPPSTTAPDGIRVYADDPAIYDKTERGDFQGERSDTLTYQLTKAGSLTLPASTYVWWNPKTEKMEKTTLPAVSFEVAQPPTFLLDGKPAVSRSIWIWLLVIGCIGGFGGWHRESIASWVKQARQFLNPPERVAAKKLIRACSLNDATGALSAWIAWQNTQGSPFKPHPALSSAVLLLQRYLFGPDTGSQWQGDDLAREFGAYINAMKAKPVHGTTFTLPRLN